MKTTLALALLCLLVGCDDGGATDGGSVDSGPVDSGSVDSGPGPIDAGAPDGGPMPPPPCTAPPASPYALIDLGHDSLERLARFGGRVLSAEEGRWVLWNAADGSQVANGGGRLTASSSSAFLVRNGAFCVRATSDGALLSMLELTSHGGLATDGSYVWTATDVALSIWDTDGTRRAQVMGDYTGAAIHAAPGELRMARGPAGLDRVERIDATTGAATTGAPMMGEFLSWFRDGAHVFTRQGTTIWVYDASGAQVGVYALPTTSGLGGYGEYFWTHQPSTPGYPLTFYRLDGGGAPLETESLTVDTEVVYSGGRIGLLRSGTDLEIVELASGAPTRTSYTLPSSYNEHFAADDVGWVVGSRRLEITAHGTGAAPDAEVSLGYGVVTAVDGTVAGRVAVATSSRRVLIVDASTGAIERTVELDADQVELSADGTRLAASAGADDVRTFPDRTLHLYALSDGSEIVSWPSMYDGGSAPSLRTFSFSPDGDVVARVIGRFSSSAWSYERVVHDLMGTPIVEDMDALERVVFAPDGEHYALTRSSGGNGTSNVYRDGALVTAVNGVAVAWLPGPELVTQRQVVSSSSDVTTYTMRWGADGTALGEVDTLPSLAERDPFRSTYRRRPLFGISASEVYAPGPNRIYQWPSGAERAWPERVEPGLLPNYGARAGSVVVHAVGHELLAVPY